MFTGIVEELGRVASVEHGGEGVVLEVLAERVLHDVAVGDSIAVNGCCVTVTAHRVDRFTADLMDETLRVTTLGELAVGDEVNLERAMAADGRFGGHLVQGHVDGLAMVRQVERLPGTTFLHAAVTPDLAHMIVPKGSITLDGVSLTVVDIDDAGMFRIGLIPHTASETTLGTRREGDRLNVEVDVVGKYVARLLAAGLETPYRAERGTRGRTS